MRGKKKIIAILTAVMVLTVGMSMSIFAKTHDASKSLGTLDFLTLQGNGYKTATASTRITNGAQPAPGYTGTVILYTTNESGTVKEVTETSAKSVTTVSRSAASGHYLKKARAIHHQNYMSDVILTEYTSLP